MVLKLPSKGMAVKSAWAVCGIELREVFSGEGYMYGEERMSGESLNFCLKRCKSYEHQLGFHTENHF